MISRPEIQQERPAQLALDLQYRPALERHDLIVTEANHTAVAWIDAWPDWPAFGIVLCGPPRCGKTHLTAVWQAKAAAIRVEGPDLTASSVPGLAAKGSPVAIEQANEADEESLLHLFNSLAEQGKSMILTGEAPPARWNIALPDLSSRLLALPVAPIAPPDDTLLGAVLKKRFADRGAGIGDGVAAYLAARIERSFAAADAMVIRIDDAAVRAHRAITLRFVQDLFNRAADGGDA